MGELQKDRVNTEMQRRSAGHAETWLDLTIRPENWIELRTSSQSLFVLAEFGKNENPRFTTCLSSGEKSVVKIDFYDIFIPASNSAGSSIALSKILKLIRI